jgi:hypothetical protein
MTFYLHVSDPPIRLESGARFSDHTVIVGGSLYGRVLFTEPVVAIECVGTGITISNCQITLPRGVGTAIRVSR